MVGFNEDVLRFCILTSNSIIVKEAQSGGKISKKGSKEGSPCLSEGRLIHKLPRVAVGTGDMMIPTYLGTIYECVCESISRLANSRSNARRTS